MILSTLTIWNLSYLYIQFLALGSSQYYARRFLKILRGLPLAHKLPCFEIHRIAKSYHKLSTSQADFVEQLDLSNEE